MVLRNRKPCVDINSFSSKEKINGLHGSGRVAAKTESYPGRYTEKEYRCNGIAGCLLNMIVNDLKAKEITPVYLVTEHIGFYERFGWEFLY